jgi:hypothetical protein
VAKNKVINTVLQLRDNMSGGLLKAARNAKKSGAQISDDMIKATRQVVAFKNKVQSTAVSAAKNFAKIGAASAGAVAALAAKTGFSEALDLEGYRLQLETATKDTQKAGEIMRYAIDLANKTPFEGGALVEGAAKFEAMGMSATQWLSRAGDMAAATNKDFDQAVEALIDAQSGELERLKEFGITKAKILEKGEKLFAGVQLENNKGQIVNQEKFNEAMLALMQDRFAGGMAKQASTMKGLWSTVTGVTKSALAKIVGITEDGSIQSGSALDLLKGKVQGLEDRLAEWQQDGTIDRLASGFNDGLSKALDFAGNAMQWCKENSGLLTGGLKLLAGAFVMVKIGQFNAGLTNGISAIGGFVGTIRAMTAATMAQAGASGTATAAQNGLNAALKANPIGFVITLIEAAIAAGVLLYQNWDALREGCGKVWDKAKKAFGGIRDTIVGAFDSAKRAVSGFFSWLDDRIESIPLLGQLYKGGKTLAGGALDWLDDVTRITPRNALGTSYWQGGPTRVNERGGEIMNLPNGTQIIPHDVSLRAARGPQVTVNVTVQGNVIGNRQYADEMGNIIVRRILAAVENM